MHTWMQPLKLTIALVVVAPQLAVVEEVGAGEAHDAPQLGSKAIRCQTPNLAAWAGNLHAWRSKSVAANWAGVTCMHAGMHGGVKACLLVNVCMLMHAFIEDTRPLAVRAPGRRMPRPPCRRRG